MASIASSQPQERRLSAAIDFSGANFFGIVCAILMLFAFIFMPWAGNLLQDNGARMMSDSVVGPFPEFFVYEPVTIFAIPITALLALGASLWGMANVDRGRNASYLTAVIGLLPFVYFLPALMILSESPVHAKGAGIGFWFVLACALGLVGQTLITRPAINQGWQSTSTRLGSLLPSLPRRFVPYMFLLFPLILYLLWIIGPTIYTFYLSITNWDGVSTPAVNGLYNYERLFGFGRFVTNKPEAMFGLALGNNLGALLLAFGFLAAMMIAAQFNGSPNESQDEQRTNRRHNIAVVVIALVTWAISTWTYRPPVEGESYLGIVLSNLPALVVFIALGLGIVWAWYDYNSPSGARLALLAGGLALVLWVVFTWLANPGGAAGNFVVALNNNLRWLAVFITVPTTVGLALALVFNNEMAGGRWYKVSFYAPLVLSLPVIGLVWSWIYNPRLGLMNSLLRGVGIAQPPGWLAQEELAIWCIIIAAVWRQVGYVMVLYLAGLKNIDPTFVDAALVDGANRRQLFTRVILPLLSPVTTIVIIISIIDSLRSFDLVQIMTRGNTETEVLANLMYIEAFNNYEMGYGAAIAVILFAISLVFIGFYLWRSVRTELEY